MSVAINTLGVSVSYCVETTAGTRPTTGYTEIPNIKEIPEMNPEPEALDSTDLSETEYKTYIDGLKDLGGALSFTANFNNDLQTKWETMMTAYEGLDEGLSMWFMIKHPKLTKAVYFKGQPSAMGLPSMSVNAVLETTLYITPISGPTWETKPAA